MKEWIEYKNSICNKGNLYRLKQVLKMAEANAPITVAFLGGSITQGSLATTDENCYAHRVFSWWEETFPDGDFTYVNAGIGGTTSHFGAARVDHDVLAYEPDVVFVEFSVNDESNPHFLETYEGLVRHIWNAPSAPAVILISNVYYHNGGNAQLIHEQVARQYDLPLVSMQSAIYPAVREGHIANRDITPDDLHPNDMGHMLVASVITYFLDHVLEEVLIGELPPFAGGELPAPLTANTYEAAQRLDNRNSNPTLCGFVVDTTKQHQVRECFCNGWLASKNDAVFAMEVEGSGIALQYRRYKDGHAPKAYVRLDGEDAGVLDGNFDETWGDKLELTTVLEHGTYGKHRLEVVIDGAEAEGVPFSLVSVIVAK